MALVPVPRDMGNDDAAETAPGGETDVQRSRIEALEAHVSPQNPLIAERVSLMHARLKEYEQTESDAERRDLIEQVEARLDEVRDAIEEEVDQGESKAHDLLDDIERRLAKLR